MKNQVTLIGYVGAEPETRAYPSGDLVTSISLATSEKWRDRQSNELKEHTEWHRVVFRDRGGFKLGLRAKDLIQKGAKLFVQGPQRTRSWEKDGIKHRLTEVATAFKSGSVKEPSKSYRNNAQLSIHFTA